MFLLFILHSRGILFWYSKWHGLPTSDDGSLFVRPRGMTNSRRVSSQLEEFAELAQWIVNHPLIMVAPRTTGAEKKGNTSYKSGCDVSFTNWEAVLNVRPLLLLWWRAKLRFHEFGGTHWSLRLLLYVASLCWRHNWCYVIGLKQASLSQTVSPNIACKDQTPMCLYWKVKLWVSACALGRLE